MNEMKWKIWYETFNNAGEKSGAGVCLNSYTRKGDAVRVAKKRFNDSKRFKWVVSQTNPFEEKR